MMAVTSHTVSLLTHSAGWVGGPVGLAAQNKQTPPKLQNNWTLINRANQPCLSCNPLISSGESKYRDRMCVNVLCFSKSKFNLDGCFDLNWEWGPVLLCNPEALYLALRTVSCSPKCDPWPSYLEEAILSMGRGFCDLSWLQTVAWCRWWG